MRGFLEILGFELRLQFRSPMLWGLAALFFAAHLLTLTQVGIHISDNQLIDFNSPYLIFRTELVLCVFGMAPAMFFVANAASRDYGLLTAELFFSRPVSKAGFLLGRFFGGAICALLVALAGVLGSVTGSFMPWLDPVRVAGFSLQPYVLAFALMAAPTMLVFSAFAFCVAALSRGIVLSFAIPLGFVVLALVLNGVALDAPDWVAMLEPFGGLAMERDVRFWSVDQMNTLAPIGLLPANRLLWLALGAAALALTLAWFRPEPATGGKGWFRRGRAAVPTPAASTAALPRPRFGLGATAAQFASQWRMDLSGVFKGPLFWLVVAMTVFSTANEISINVSAMMDLPMHPLTSRMLGFLRYGMLQYVLLVIIFFSGVLMHRERDHRLHEIVGATPHPDWLPLVSKVLTLCTVVMVLLASSVLTSVVWQLFKDQFDVEPGVYFLSVFVFSGFYFCMLAVLACLIQVLSPGKWSGMLLTGAVMAGLISLPVAGLEHLLYGFRLPYVVYTDMNGFGHFQTQTYSLMLYWGSFCVLLLAAGHLLFARGAQSGLGARIKEAGRRFTTPVVLTCIAAGVVFLTAGGWIFYNTNILNDYETAASRLKKDADYERRYGAFREAPAPAITDIDIAVDLHPMERRMETRGKATLRNTQTQPLTRVFVTTDPRLAVETLALKGATLTIEDRRQGVFLFDLATPLPPGGETTMTWRVRRQARGFVNSVPDNEVVENGTFVPLMKMMPLPFYNIERELSSAAERKRARMAPAPRLPALGDPKWINKLGFGADAFANFHAVFSTDEDQIAVAPGRLEREWRDGGRRYFEYRMEIPTRPVVLLMSARYTVARDRWKHVDIEVYHDAKHPWNVQAMLGASKTALEYFDREFAPYPLSHFRVIEFPGYREQAQAYAGAISYSETVGFMNDLSGWGPLDYTTIHELAHQWWGGMAYGARMQGRQILNEGLAQYATFMLFEQQADQRPLRKILAHTHNAYLAARSEESVAEQPILLSEDQGYISYNKTPLAMFALKEVIGEEKVHHALRAYLARFGMKSGGPFPTSLDLVNELRAVSGPEHQALITDLFERITLYDVSVKSATSRRVGDAYEVVMDVEARQFRSDGGGRETEVPLDAPFEVVVFPAGRDLMALEPLYKAHHRLRSGAQRITVRVADKPGAAGVDPYHLMIDKTPDNNVVRLP